MNSVREAVRLTRRERGKRTLTLSGAPFVLHIQHVERRLLVGHKINFEKLKIVLTPIWATANSVSFFVRVCRKHNTIRTSLRPPKGERLVIGGRVCHVYIRWRRWRKGDSDYFMSDLVRRWWTFVSEYRHVLVLFFSRPKETVWLPNCPFRVGFTRKGKAKGQPRWAEFAWGILSEFLILYRIILIIKRI